MTLEERLLRITGFSSDQIEEKRRVIDEFHSILNDNIEYLAKMADQIALRQYSNEDCQFPEVAQSFQEFANEMRSLKHPTNDTATKEQEQDEGF